LFGEEAFETEGGGYHFRIVSRDWPTC